MDSTQVCSACNQAKPATGEFFPSRLKKDGSVALFRKCRTCYGWGEGALEPAPQLRLCGICQVEKPLTLEFFASRGRSRATKVRLYKADCKACLEKPSEFQILKSEGKKRCPRCQIIYPATSEFFNPSRAKGFVQTYCKPCHTKTTVECVQRKKSYYRTKDIQYRLGNPEAYKAIRKRFNLSLKGKLSRSRANRMRKARVKGALGKYTESEWENKLESYGGKCHWCGEPTGEKLHRDHLIPLSKGGTNFINNLVPACEGCNCSKQAKMPHEWGGRLL